MSDHEMLAFIGLANMASKILRCLLFMIYGTTSKCQVKRENYIRCLHTWDNDTKIIVQQRPIRYSKIFQIYRYFCGYYFKIR